MDGAHQTCDVMVIGSGMAGSAAALFALGRGLSVTLAGGPGGLDFSSGLIDLLAIHPVAHGKAWDDPWAAMKELISDEPGHPYRLASPADIRSALAEITAYLAERGHVYRHRDHKNSKILTPMGTLKRTYLVPESMWPGVAAREERAPTLVVDFEGLKGWSGRQIVEVRKGDWPQLKCAVVPFPDQTGELYPERLAAALAAPATREALARLVAPHLEEARYAAFPALLGVADQTKVRAHLEELLGIPIFEIPILPPSIAGARLKQAFDLGLAAHGARLFPQQLVHKAEIDADGHFVLSVGAGAPPPTVRARACILCGGRFFGKGLESDRGHLFEPLFGLPVSQPEKRDHWYREVFFDSRGHPVNRAGLITDDQSRPLKADGRPFHQRLFAAGAILAGQDWMRSRCGGGLSIATAWAAVASLAKALGKPASEAALRP